MNYQHRYYDSPTTIQTSVLNGHLLGDGSLSILHSSTSGSSLMITRTLDDYDYCVWSYEIFKNFCGENALRKASAKANIFQANAKNTVDGIYTRAVFYTNSCLAFAPFKQKWYPNGKKIIPNDLTLDALTIAVWLADDGHVSARPMGKNGRIPLRAGFATNSFSEEEVYFLRDKLNDRYNVLFNVSSPKVNGKKQFTINGNDHATRPLLQDIDPVFMPCMSRKSDKWRLNPDWSLSSKSTSKNINQNFNNLKIKIINSILSNNFNTIDSICNEHNLFWVDCTGMKRHHKSLKSIINRYLQEGLIVLTPEKTSGNLFQNKISHIGFSKVAGAEATFQNYIEIAFKKMRAR